MTAEQPKEKIHLDLDKYDWFHIKWAANAVPHQMERATSFQEYHDVCRYLVEFKEYAETLARQVAAAEKLAESLEEALANDDDHWALCSAALAAYREASK